MGCLKIPYNNNLTFTKSKKGACRDYLFGFNTQQREDEIAGIGNHNSALFWEYDTRLGRRWNLDPVDQVGISNYAVNRNNPTWITDPLGDNGKVTSEKVDDKTTNVNISSTIYVIGKDAEEKVKLFQSTFDATRENVKKSVTIDGHTYNMSISLTYVVGTKADAERLENEVSNNNPSGDNYINLTETGSSKVVGLSLNNLTDKSIIKTNKIPAPLLRADINTKTSSASTGVHEPLHLVLGLQDRYSHSGDHNSFEGYKSNWMGAGEDGRTELKVSQWENIMNYLINNNLQNGGIIINYTEKFGQ